MLPAMALRVDFRRGSPALVLLLAALAGCGGGKEVAAPATSVTPTAPPNLVTADYLREQVAAQTSGEPAEMVLRFWRDLQYSNFTRAYARLGRELREEVTYAEFAAAFNTALPLFMYRPRIQSVEDEDGLTTVFLLIQTGPRPAVTDPPMAFNLRVEDGDWRIVTDPRNVLGTAAGS